MVRQWKRGEKADKVAAIALNYLSGTLVAISMANLYEAVKKEVIRRNLDIPLTESRLKILLIAEKRSFYFFRNEKGMFFSLSGEVLLNALNNIVKKSIRNNVRSIFTAQKSFAAKKRAAR